MPSTIPTIQVGTDKQTKVIEPVFLTGLGPDGQPKAIGVDADGKIDTTGGGTSDALTDAQLRATPVPVSVTASEAHIGEVGGSSRVCMDPRRAGTDIHYGDSHR